MVDEGLSSFVVQYFSTEKKLQLESLQKAEKNALAKAVSSAEKSSIEKDFAHRYSELNREFELSGWLSDIIDDLSKLKLVTHAKKYTNGYAKGSSINLWVDVKESDACFSTATLLNPVLDMDGNGAYIKAAKIFLKKVNGISLCDQFLLGDFSSLSALSKDKVLLDEWIRKIGSILKDSYASHKLAKQIYFPVGDNQYHLLSPLFATSLAHALHERIVAARFSEEAKEVYAAFKNETWHSQPRTSYLNTALQTFGGTKPQNISYLNSVRGGKVRLLSCAAPVWQNISKPPLKHKSIFHFGSEFSRAAYASVGRLKHYLLSVYGKESTFEIRQQRESYVDEIIDILFNYVAGVHQFDNPGWSAENECELKRSQQLWFDPLRSKTDDAFRLEREAGDWKKEIARDFGYWLSQQLSSSGESGKKNGLSTLAIADTERRYFSTAALFKKRLREMEQAVKEDLLCI